MEKVGDVSVECGLCTIVVSEVWGELQENRTVSDIENIVKKNICAHLPTTIIQGACNLLASDIPAIAKELENREDVSKICQSRGLCKKPYAPHKDPEPVAKHTISLATTPSKRWADVCSPTKNAKQVAVMDYLINTVQQLLPGHGKALRDIGDLMNDLFPAEYGQEIAGCAAAAGGNVSTGWLALFNVGYEASDACTSMIVTDSDGLPLHGRNLDFFSGGGFTDSLKDMAIEVDWTTSHGHIAYTSSTFPGFAGSLSIQKAGVAAVTIDTRFQKAGVEFLFYEILRALQEKDVSMVSFLARSAVAQGNTWEEVVETLSSKNLVADVYYTASGIKKGHGVVLARNPTSVRVWHLNTTVGGPKKNAAYESPTGPFLLETNYPWWSDAPWFDDRRDPGIEHVRAVPKGGMSRDALFQIMSTKPTFNAQTVWTNILKPATGHYETWQRWCDMNTGCVQ
jgi:Linear amide C-N hydrolases, choloylglycine hydrolase family